MGKAQEQPQENSVDFVRRLSDEYNKLRGEYLKLQDRYNALSAEAEYAGSGPPLGRESLRYPDAAGKEAIAEALLEAQAAAKQILERAKYESYQAVDACQKECEALRAQMQQQKDETLDSLKAVSTRVIEIIRDLGGGHGA